MGFDQKFYIAEIGNDHTLKLEFSFEDIGDVGFVDVARDPVDGVGADHDTFRPGGNGLFKRRQKILSQIIFWD